MKIIKKLKNIVEAIVNSNFWIATATLCFYELSLLHINQKPVFNYTSIFLFFSTLFVYNFFRILAPKNDCKTWYAKHYSYTKILSFIALGGTAISFYFIEKQYILVLIISGILSFLYASPFLGKYSLNLRKYWFLKSIIVATVWSLSTSVLPLLENNISMQIIILFSLEKFLFILGITIPYDIKDIRIDQADGISTIALKFGLKKTKIISYIFLSLGLTFAIFLHQNHIFESLVIYLTAIFLNFKLDETKDEFWYTFFIDGSIILYFLLVYIF